MTPPEISSLRSQLRLDLVRARCPDLVAELFGSLAAWEEWRSRNAWIFSHDRLHVAFENAAANGLRSLWFGNVAPGDVKVVGEGAQRFVVSSQWAYPRHRMILDLVAAIATPSHAELRIYAPEAMTEFALALRGRYPRFLGSEYRPDSAERDDLYPVEHQDITKLTLPTGAFDLVITQEVFEHVPNLPDALAEVARILRPGGLMLSTFPFRWNSEHAEIKAWQADGQIIHLTEPEYHVDTVRRTQDSLVYQIPGWDILNLAREVGFRSAAMLLCATASGAVVGQHMAGLWCMVCRR